MAPSHLPLLLGFLLLSTAAHSQHLHLEHHGHGPHPHPHRSPSMMTATARLDTAPSMHQNRMESESEETRQSLRVLNPFFTTAQAPSGEDAMAAMRAAADAGDTTWLDLPSPTPSLPAAGDLVSCSIAPLQPQAQEAGSSASEPAASPPVVNEPYLDAASTPPPPPVVVDEPYHHAASAPPPPLVVDEPYRDATRTPPPPPVAYEPFRDAASPPPPPPVGDEPSSGAAFPPAPVHNDPARVEYSGTGDDLGLQQIAKVLASLGYNEMASSATLLADSTPVVTWTGAITIFAAPDVFLQRACAECSRRHLLLDHMALGYYPYAELAAAPTRKLPAASVGFCLDVAAQPQHGTFSVHRGSLYVNGVMVSEPEVYDDGRYVVHGLHGFIPPLSGARASCDMDMAHAHHNHQVHLHHNLHHDLLSTRSAASSATVDGAGYFANGAFQGRGLMEPSYCDSILLAAQLVENCNIGNVQPSRRCCAAVLSTIDLQDKDCFCTVVEEAEFTKSDISISMIWRYYRDCGGRQQRPQPPKDYDKCEHAPAPGPPPPSPPPPPPPPSPPRPPSPPAAPKRPSKAPSALTVSLVVLAGVVFLAGVAFYVAYKVKAKEAVAAGVRVQVSEVTEVGVNVPDVPAPVPVAAQPGADAEVVPVQQQAKVQLPPPPPLLEPPPVLKDGQVFKLNGAPLIPIRPPPLAGGGAL